MVTGARSRPATVTPAASNGLGIFSWRSREGQRALHYRTGGHTHEEMYYYY